MLTVDLGTSATKAALWRGTELCALARAPIGTSHPVPGRAEQDPHDWWQSVLRACADLLGTAPAEYEAVGAVGFSSVRETFALFDAELHPLTSGILWSDVRAESAARALGDPDIFRATTGVVLTGGTHAAKLAWVAETWPEALADARWVLQPRDLVLARLTGTVVTDETLASRTGLYELSGGWLPEARASYGERLPRVVESTTVVGAIEHEVARMMQLSDDVQVVAGAGDRACEVLGTGASVRAPMVSFGTTANVSVPHEGPASGFPARASVSRGARGGFVVEVGLSTAGGAMAWLSSLTGRAHDELFESATDVAPGADGVLALPWLGGARAPWWRPDARAAFIGLTDAHGPAVLARAIVEGVAFDVARGIELVAPDAAEVVVAGGGAGQGVWRTVLAATAARPVVRRALDDAASVGARLVVAAALGEDLKVDDLNPVVEHEHPDAALVDAYREVRGAADAAAAAILGLGAQGMVERTFVNPFEAEYSRPGGPWFEQTLPRLLGETPRRPDLLRAGDATLGTDEFRERVQSVAGGLRERGVGHGEPVMWRLPNGLEAAVLYWATWWVGAVAVPFHPAATPEEMSAVLGRFRSKIEIRPEPGDQLTWLRGVPVREPAAAPHDVAAVLTTSGTSGVPKSVIHTHRTLAYKARQIRDVHGTGPDDAILVPAPLAHLAGMLHGVLHPIATGAKAVLMERWDAERALALVRDERVTMLFGPPIYALGIVGAPGYSRHAVASVRVISSGGTTITEEFAHRMSEEFGAVVKRSYGSTETPTITSSFPGDPPEMGWATDGRTIGDVELDVRDPASGQPVADGEEGELWVRGPELAEGYLDRHQTGAAFVDGWYRTSDLATIDDGWLRIVGRSADVIIRGGMNVSAAEVEQALERHPSVREAVVVGYPDEIYDERIGAFVVVDPSAGGAPVDRAAWVEWFATVGVARYKVPDRVVVVDEIPVLPTFQKPDRDELRRRLVEE